MLKGEWEDHKPLSNAEEGEESFGSLQEGPQQSTGAKSQLLLPARHLSFHGGNLSYLVTWVPLPAAHLLYKPPLRNHQDDHIHLHSRERNKADSGFSAQGRPKPPLQTRLSPKQRGACKNSPLQVPPKSTSTWLGCGTSAQLEQTRFWPPAVTRNAKWGADGWVGSRSSNQN